MQKNLKRELFYQYYASNTHIDDLSKIVEKMNGHGLVVVSSVRSLACERLSQILEGPTIYARFDYTDPAQLFFKNSDIHFSLKSELCQSWSETILRFTDARKEGLGYVISFEQFFKRVVPMFGRCGVILLEITCLGGLEGVPVFTDMHRMGRACEELCPERRVLDVWNSTPNTHIVEKCKDSNRKNPDKTFRSDGFTYDDSGVYYRSRKVFNASTCHYVIFVSLVDQDAPVSRQELKAILCKNGHKVGEATIRTLISKFNAAMNKVVGGDHRNYIDYVRDTRGGKIGWIMNLPKAPSAPA